MAPRFHVFEAGFSSTRSCFVQWMRSGEEKASRKVCSPHGYEYVGYTQYTPSYTFMSGSAYQPSANGLPAVAGRQSPGPPSPASVVVLEPESPASDRLGMSASRAELMPASCPASVPLDSVPESMLEPCEASG